MPFNGQMVRQSAAHLSISHSLYKQVVAIKTAPYYKKSKFLFATSVKKH